MSQTGNGPQRGSGAQGHNDGTWGNQDLRPGSLAPRRTCLTANALFMRPLCAPLTAGAGQLGEARTRSAILKAGLENARRSNRAGWELTASKPVCVDTAVRLPVGEDAGGGVRGGLYSCSRPQELLLCQERGHVTFQSPMPRTPGLRSARAAGCRPSV